MRKWHSAVIWGGILCGSVALVWAQVPRTPTLVNLVAGGGTGAATFTAGVVTSPGGTTALTTVTGTTGVVPQWSSNTLAASTLAIGATKSLTNNTATTVISATLASNTVVAARIDYAAQVFDGTDVQVEEGTISCHATNKATVIANNTCVKAANQQAMTAGTLAVTWTITAASPALIQVNVNSSLTPSANFPKITYTVQNLTSQAMAANQ